MFAYALAKMAQYNNQEQQPQKHIVMNVVGWIFVGLSGIVLISCIVSLFNVDFPPEIIGPFISPNMIVRPTSATLYWGYPTLIQNSILSSASGVFAFLGFGGYFLLFKSSHSSWWEKIVKFFTVILLYTFMASATNFHYFDIWEFIAPILFVVLLLIIVNRKPQSKKSSPIVESQIIPETTIESQDNFTKNVIEDYSPNSSTIEGTESVENKPKGTDYFDEQISIQYTNTIQIDTPQKKNLENIEYSNDGVTKVIENDIRFCKHCGKRIETDSIFCKYCGKNIKDSNTNKKFSTVLFNKIKYNCSKLYGFYSLHGLNVKSNFHKRIMRPSQNHVFDFSSKWKICLGAISLILVGIIVWWFLLYKYDNESWLCDTYYFAILFSSIGLVFIIITWLSCVKQNKVFRLWRKALLWCCLIISIIGTIVSTGCFLDTLFSNRLEEAKVIYANNKALNSDKIDILNKELNRRFDFYCNDKNYYSSVQERIYNDNKYFEILNREAEQENGVAQGILGEYYFATGYDQLKVSKNEYGSVSDVKLYNRGKNNMERAFYWWKKACENQDARGLYRMGNCYANIIEIEGISKDLNKAYEYWTAAAEKGYGMAYKRLGDLFGTWDYLGAFSIEISNDGDTTSETIIQGVDVYGTDEKPRFSKPFPLPKEWKHDISIAREYWQNAVKCGGSAADKARECLEKVYPEEKKQSQNNLNTTKIINNPTFNNSRDRNFSIRSITLNPESTIIECSWTNPYSGGYMHLDSKTYIKVPTGNEYFLTKSDGIAINPKTTSFERIGQTKSFKLYFPAIPIDTQEIDLIEPNSAWQFSHIKLE